VCVINSQAAVSRPTEYHHQQ